MGEGQDFGDHAALRSARWPGAQSPFCALSVAMDLDDGGVHHGVFHVRLVRGGIEKPFENIGAHPVAMPLEDGVPAAEERWQIAPGAAGSRDPQHRLDKPAVIRAAPAGVRLLPPAMQLRFAHWASVSTNGSIASLKHGILIKKFKSPQTLVKHFARGAVRPLAPVLRSIVPNSLSRAEAVENGTLLCICQLPHTRFNGRHYR